MSATVSPEYRFGDFRLLPAQRQLLHTGTPIKLGGRAFDMLLTLVEDHDRAIPKRELMDRVWPKLVVEENNLQVQVVALRKVLGPAAIATVPGRGYRFTLPVEAVNLAPAQPPHSLPEVNASQGEVRRTNLPDHLPALYGRHTEVETVRALLERHALVSIVGAGGIGKTRLAQAVAHAVRGAFGDGVWLVELAALNDPDLVAPEIARALDIPLSDRRPALESIVAALATQSLLLVLDNCEHLLDTVASTAETLTQRLPMLRILVTSQEPLKTADEHVFRLETLRIPAEQQLQEAADFGAVQLFVCRAQALDPRFVLTDENTASVVEICRRLDGIPLALELAAARVPLLGIEGLRSRLDDRFHVLTGGSRFILRRHQTLRAALDFSHGLLSADEQTAFRRLGVFAGSFELDSAQEVCVDDRMSHWQVLDCLGVLVDKSMVVAERGKYPRLRLLETTRAYALEKLADAGETAERLARHAYAIGMRMSGCYDVYLRGPEDEWRAQFEFELDNLRAALEWALDHDSELAIALIGDSLKLWQELALQPEALRYCERAIRLIGARTPARAAGRLWYALAMIVANTWRDRSRDAAARAVELLREANDVPVLAHALTRLAGWSRSMPTKEQFDAAAELQCLDDPAWPLQLRALPHSAYAMVYRAAGRLAEARRHLEMTTDLYARAGATSQELRSRHMVAATALMMGDVDYSVSANRQLAPRLAGRDRLWYMIVQAHLATSLLFKGDVAAARESFMVAAPLIMSYDLGFGYADSAALLAALEDRPAVAARMLGYSQAANAAHHGQDARGDPTQQTARKMALERLRAREDAAAVEQWMQEGATLNDAEAYRQALMTTDVR